MCIQYDVIAGLPSSCSMLTSYIWKQTCVVSVERRMDHLDERWHIGALALHSISHWRIHWLLKHFLHNLCSAATVCTPLDALLACFAGALHHSLPDQPERLVNLSFVCCCGWYSGPVLSCAYHDMVQQSTIIALMQDGHGFALVH